MMASDENAAENADDIGETLNGGTGETVEAAPSQATTPVASSSTVSPKAEEEETEPKVVSPRVLVRRRVTVRVLVGVIVVLLVLVGVRLSGFSFAQGGGDGDDASSVQTLASQDPFYVLLIGSDTRKGTALYTGNPDEHAQVDQHADAITLVRVAPATHQITLVSVPRDTQIQGTETRLCDTLLTNNPTETVSAVQRITGVGITSYFMVDYADFETLMTSIGSIKVDVPKTLSMQDPISAKTVKVTAGEDKSLNASASLAFAHNSTTYALNGEACRQSAVRDVEQATITKVLDMNDAKVQTAVKNLMKNTTTNMDQETLLSLAVDFAAAKESIVIYSISGPYEITAEFSDGLGYVPENATAWRTLMSAVDAGADPAGIIPLPDPLAKAE